jgi:hypothetical protein
MQAPPPQKQPLGGVKLSASGRGMAAPLLLPCISRAVLASHSVLMKQGRQLVIRLCRRGEGGHGDLPGSPQLSALQANGQAPGWRPQPWRGRRNGANRNPNQHLAAENERTGPVRLKFRKMLTSTYSRTKCVFTCRCVCLLHVQSIKTFGSPSFLWELKT